MEEVRMKKAEELYAYSCGHNFGKDLSRAKGLTNFHLIEEAMDPDEFAYLVFIGLHRFHSMSAHQRNFAYAFTNKRVLMAQMRSFRRPRMESVPLNTIMNLSFDHESSIGILKIMMPEDAICVGMTQESVQALSEELNRLLPVIQLYAKELPEMEG